MDISKYVGSKIRYYRTRNNITQQELGDYLGTTSQTISRYESGILHTDNEILYKLADYFKISINDFFPPIENESLEDKEERYKQILIEKGLMDKDGNIDENSFIKLMDFAAANKDFIINKKD